MGQRHLAHRFNLFNSVVNAVLLLTVNALSRRISENSLL